MNKKELNHLDGLSLSCKKSSFRNSDPSVTSSISSTSLIFPILLMLLKYSGSVYHYLGNEQKGIELFRWTGTEWLDEFIDAYGEVYPNLSVHAEGYPEPEYLRSISKIGNISDVVFLPTDLYTYIPLQ